MLGILLGEIWVRIVCKLVIKLSGRYFTDPFILGLWSSVIPLRMVWMSAAFKIIGGGDQVLTAIAMVIVADVFSEDERYGYGSIFRWNQSNIYAEQLRSSVYNLASKSQRFWPHH